MMIRFMIRILIDMCKGFVEDFEEHVRKWILLGQNKNEFKKKVKKNGKSREKGIG